MLSVMSTTIKKQSTVSKSPLNNWIRHAEFARESNYSRKGLLVKEYLK